MAVIVIYTQKSIKLTAVINLIILLILIQTELFFHCHQFTATQDLALKLASKEHYALIGFLQSLKVWENDLPFSRP